MQTLLWILICFGAGLVILGLIAVVAGIALNRPAPKSATAAARESSVWIVIAEKVLGWFEKLIGLLLSDDTPRWKRWTAVGLILILAGLGCIGGGVYGISVVGAAAAARAVAQVAGSLEVA
jgi:hypothetical protein